jgi:hypothetical protein
VSGKLPGGGIKLSPAEIEALDTRWSSSWTPGEVARYLAGIAGVHQTWLRDPATGNYLLDVLREPHDGDTWICRRDETIRLPYRDIIHRTRDGIPYLAPELVLLFKAKHARRKDQADFDATVPHMTPAQREALAWLLARVHQGHPWLADL